jgi:hypothetical protein
MSPAAPGPPPDLDPLPAPIRARFAAPHYAGPLEGCFDEQRQGEAGEPALGTWIRLQLGLRHGRVAAARFAAYGCPWTVAACDWLAEQLVGCAAPGLGAPAGGPKGEPAGGRAGGPAGDLARLGGPLDWARELGLPQARLTRLLVLEDALRAAWQSPAVATG